MLEADTLSVGYREGIDILQRLSLRAAPRTITAIIGPNGAGKSTLLKCLFGLLPARTGQVRFNGQVITDWPTERRKAAGIAYLPQHHSTFPHLTVEENLKLGGWLIRHDRAQLAQRLEHVYTLFPALAERRKTRATNLSGGQLRQLAVAKEIMVPPRLLLVDEPSVGMSPRVAAELYELLVQMPAWGITVILVDQNISDAVRIAERVYLIGEGRVLREDSGRWFSEHMEEVIRSMLHGGFEASGAAGPGPGSAQRSI